MQTQKKPENKKIKILAIGDIHGDSTLVKNLADRAEKENVDLVILAGDLTMADQSTKGIIGPFLAKKKKVFIVHGNHESIATTDFLTEVYTDTKNIHGYSTIHKDIGIFGAGGAIGFGTTSEKEIFDLLKKGNSYLKGIDKKIMVTHMHHAGSKAEFSGFKGSKGIKEAIEKFQPDFAISAHIHEAGGLIEKIGKTTVINVARNAAIFEI